jgi:hypothetical protein
MRTDHQHNDQVSINKIDPNIREENLYYFFLYSFQFGIKKNNKWNEKNVKDYWTKTLIIYYMCGLGGTEKKTRKEKNQRDYIRNNLK